MDKSGMNQPSVEILDIPGWDGYGASRDGRIWTKRKRGFGSGTRYGTWKPLKATLLKSRGRLQVCLYRGSHSRRKKMQVHRLILMTFVGPCPTGKEACHRNDNPLDNNLCNLYWGTKTQNIKDAQNNGCIQYGEHHHNSTLTSEQVDQMMKEYHALRENGVNKIPHGSVSALAEKFGVCKSTIQKIYRGLNWKKRKEGQPCIAS